MIGCSIALGILAVIVGFGVGAISGTPATGAAAAVLLTPLVYVVLIYFLLRFGFLLSTIVIAQDKIALGQSWRLSRGNFWRILAIGLATYVPTIIIYYILLAVVGVNFLPPIHPGVTPDELAAWNGRLMASLRSPMPALFYVFYLLLTTGLTSAASAFAYRALVPPSEGIAAEFA
jgi:hypothetical protein